MDEMIEKLVFTSKEGLVYVAEFDRCAQQLLCPLAFLTPACAPTVASWCAGCLPCLPLWPHA
jgi:hypothetical protein